MTLSAWMIAAYSIGAWFFIQRWMTLYILYRVYKVQPMPATEIPSFSSGFKKGWAAFVILALIFLPLFLDAQAKDWLIGRLGEEGSAAYSSSVMMFTPGLVGAYAIFIGRKSISSGRLKLGKLVDIFSKSLPKVVPIAVTIYFAEEDKQDIQVGEIDLTPINESQRVYNYLHDRKKELYS
ncbi:hypothetical protein [Peribacillus simplex]|uniref:hypothetical protein n=1 Tax=Peribacillus simplex TaxID=1478 RepID=UPI0036DCCCF7